MALVNDIERDILVRFINGVNTKSVNNESFGLDETVFDAIIEDFCDRGFVDSKSITWADNRPYYVGLMRVTDKGKRAIQP